MKFVNLPLATPLAIPLATTLATVALVAVAGAANAQEPICGDVGAGGQWIAGTAEASDITGASDPLTFAALAVPEDGNGVVYFALSAETDVRLEAQPAPGGDPVIEVYDAEGGLVLTDDDSGGGLASRAETTLAAGQYCLATRGFAGSSLEADIRVGLLEHDAITQGLSGGFFGDATGPGFVGVDPCTASTPATLLGTGPIDGRLSDGGVSAVNTITGVPYYRFTIDQPQSVSITAENQDADPYIYIFDGAGTLLAENDDYQSLNSRVDFTEPLDPGSYCIGMRALSDPNVPVTFTVSGFDAQAALRDLYDLGEAAPPLDGSYPVEDLGALPGRLVRDLSVAGDAAQWLSFEIVDGGVVVIDAVEVTDSDPVIVLYEELGAEIAYNDDIDGSLDSQITARVNPGRYLLAVRQYSESYGGTIRVAIQRFVPAP